MDARLEVYNCAREGHLHSLRVFLDTRSEEEVRRLVHETTNGATPLIMACRHGHTSVVEYLVETCCADVEQVGSVTFDGELIDGAPPLWCASAAGHLDIVRFLMKAGAQVNKTTFTNSTPLRAACFDGHFEIVRFLLDNGADMEIANRHGHTCLMISCYKGHLKIVRYLLEKGADVNKKSLKGNTALHDCAEAGSLEIMRLLFEHAAAVAKDSYGMTPLLAAAVTGNTKIVEFLVGRGECAGGDRVDALMLLGATFVDKKRDLVGAVKYWKRALGEVEAGRRERARGGGIGAERESNVKGGEFGSKVSAVEKAAASQAGNGADRERKLRSQSVLAVGVALEEKSKTRGVRDAKLGGGRTGLTTSSGDVSDLSRGCQPIPGLLKKQFGVFIDCSGASTAGNTGVSAASLATTNSETSSEMSAVGAKFKRLDMRDARRGGSDRQGAEGKKGGASGGAEERRLRALRGACVEDEGSSVDGNDEEQVGERACSTNNLAAEAPLRGARRKKGHSMTREQTVPPDPVRHPRRAASREDLKGAGDVRGRETGGEGAPHRGARPKTDVQMPRHRHGSSVELNVRADKSDDLCQPAVGDDASRAALAGFLSVLTASEATAAERKVMGEVSVPQTLVPAYRHAVEARCVADIDDLSADPDSMRMHALLVRERILGPAHPDTSYYIRYRGAVYADSGDFAWCLALWTYALDMQQRHLEPLSPMTQSSFLSFAELFSFMMNAESKAAAAAAEGAVGGAGAGAGGGRVVQATKVNFADMMSVFDKAVLELERGMSQVARTPTSERDVNNFNRYLLIIVHLIALIGRVAPSLPDPSLHRFRSAVYRVVRMNARGACGRTPLHLACARETTNVGRFPVCAFPDPGVVATLLEVGAKVDAVDLERNTALHVAARACGAPGGPCKGAVEALAVLLKHGAHVDACNGERCTPLALVGGGGRVLGEVAAPMTHVTLKCLAARKIVESGVEYRGVVPTKLEAFISMH